MPEENVDIRVRLQGAKIVSAEARGVAASVDEIGDAAGRSGRQVSAFGRMSSSLSGPLTALGTATRTAGTYLGGFAAAATAFATYSGLKFNATMEQNEVAFKNFLGSSKKAKAYLNDLYDIAAKTPFEFPDLTMGARRFLAFGFGAKQAKNMLMEIGDAAAGMGGGAEEINRMTMAFGQMKAKGRIQTEELLQLAELGVPAYEYLEKGLGLSGEQLQDALRTGSVSYNQGIKALRAGMRKDFGGMSKEQAKTFSGQLSTFRDNFNQEMGKATKPAFDWLRDTALPAANKAMPGVIQGITGFLGKLPGAFEAAKGGVKTFLDALAPAQPFWDNVLRPLLEGFAIGLAGSVVGAVKVAIPVINILAKVLGFVGNILAPFSGIIRGIGTVISYVFGGVWLKAIGTLGKFGGIFRVIGSAAKVLSWPVRAVGSSFSFLMRWGGKALGLLRGPLLGVFGKLPKVLQFAGVAFEAFGKKAIGSVRSGISKVLGFVDGLGSKFFGAGKKLSDALVRGVKGIGNAVVRAFGTGLGFAGEIGRALADWLNASTPLGDHVNLPGPLPDFDMPALATGGTVTSAGAVLVGERGPEVLRLGKGARVDPLPRRALGGGGGGGGVVEHTTVLKIDGREIGRAVERYATDKLNGR